MQFLRNLATVMIRPRATMRRILDAPRGRAAVLLLFALATVSGIFGDFDAPMLEKVLERSRGPEMALLVAGVLVGVIVVLVGLMWLYAWVPYFIGKFLGGTGDVRGVRSALAWGLAPPIWALLYRVPASFWIASDASTNVRMREGTVNFDPGRIADGCGVALVIVLVELVVFVWCAYVMSNTVAEAHGYSAWHGLGTLVLAAIAPLVVMLAAFLAMA